MDGAKRSRRKGNKTSYSGIKKRNLVKSTRQARLLHATVRVVIRSPARRRWRRAREGVWSLILIVLWLRLSILILLTIPRVVLALIISTVLRLVVSGVLVVCDGIVLRIVLSLLTLVFALGVLVAFVLGIAAISLGVVGGLNLWLGAVYAVHRFVVFGRGGVLTIDILGSFLKRGALAGCASVFSRVIGTSIGIKAWIETCHSTSGSKRGSNAVARLEHLWLLLLGGTGISRFVDS